MAYIDDNNDLAAGKGKDPIGELDDELERLLKELGDPEHQKKESDTSVEPPGAAGLTNQPTPFRRRSSAASSRSRSGRPRDSRSLKWTGAFPAAFPSARAFMPAAA